MRRKKEKRRKSKEYLNRREYLELITVTPGLNRVLDSGFDSEGTG